MSFRFASSAYPQTSLAEVRAQFTREPDKGPEGRSAFDAVAYRAHIAEAVIAAQPVTDADLAALGQARAAAVRDRLLADTPEGPQEGRGRARAGPTGEAQGSGVRDRRAGRDGSRSSRGLENTAYGSWFSAVLFGG